MLCVRGRGPRARGWSDRRCVSDLLPPPTKYLWVIITLNNGTRKVTETAEHLELMLDILHMFWDTKEGSNHTMGGGGRGLWDQGACEVPLLRVQADGDHILCTGHR